MPNTEEILHPEMPNVSIDMDELMSQLNFDQDEIIEPAAPAVDGELVLESAVAEIEAKEAAVEAPAHATVAPAPAKKRTKKAKSEDGEVTPKKPATPRKFYTSKVERITDKLGADLGDYTVLTVTDAALTGDELKAKQQETLDIVSKSGVKVQNRQTNILEFASGRSSRLNPVIDHAVRLIAKEGSIRTGDKGNLHTTLVTKYSPAAARAMGNNTVAALRSLMVIKKADDGAYVVNPDSLIWMKFQGMLGL